MKKKLLYVSPILSRSGYGDHAREFAEFLTNHADDYEIHMIGTPWGHNPQTGLQANEELNDKLKNMFVDSKDVYDFYDVYIQLGLPPEFKRLGTYNIGITAGVETSKVNLPFIRGCNQMDKVIVPSTFTKESFENSIYENENIKLETNIDVVPEYAVSSFYETTPNSPIKELDNINEDFCFLFVGQWTSSPTDDGGRKNISSLIKSFGTAFASYDKRPALVLKTNGTNFSTSDYYDMQGKIKEQLDNFTPEARPNVYLLHGELNAAELKSLYSHDKIKAFATHTRGEGFGRPILEATLCGCPVIAPNWSGHLDFLDSDKSELVNCSQIKVGISNDLFCEDSTWANINETDSANSMKKIFDDYDTHKKQAVLLQKTNLKKFSKESVFKQYEELIIPEIENIPVEVELDLPDIS
jgi:glycosyltransferase involved in cell wall biosynthesis